MIVPAQSGTKEKIILSAIDLFSEKGYFETSVREIAQQCNIKVSSLYSHFTGKEEILDNILEYYRKELVKTRIPDEQMDFFIDRMSLEDILSKGFIRIIETTSTDTMNKILKILLIELYRNSKVRDFYEQWYCNENRSSVVKLFQKLQERGKIKKHDLELLASMYNAMINFYYHQYYICTLKNEETSELEEKITNHLQWFVGLLK